MGRPASWIPSRGRVITLDAWVQKLCSIVVHVVGISLAGPDYRVASEVAWSHFGTTRHGLTVSTELGGATLCTLWPAKSSSCAL